MPKLRNGQDSSLQSKVSCVPNRKTTGGTASPLAAAEKRCQCIKHAAAQLYLDEVAKRAFYTTGDYARADERLLTLCTCTYEMSDARLLIMARPLRDGETLMADEVIINPDPLLPARWPAGA